MMRPAGVKSLFAAIVVAAFASARPAGAEPLALRYSVTWGGGPAAEIRLRLEENGASFRNRIEIETVGLARLLSGFKARAVSEGEAGRSIAPVAYDAIYDSRKSRDKRLNVQFVRRPDSLVAEEGPFDTEDDPLLPLEFRRDVIDPLSGLTAIRRLIGARDLAAVPRFTLAVYDGKRRFDVEGAVISAGRTRWRGSQVETIDLRLVLRPVAGFDGENHQGDGRDAHTREIHATFTNDARAIPLRASVPIAYVPAVIVLDRDTKL